LQAHIQGGGDWLIKRTIETALYAATDAKAKSSSSKTRLEIIPFRNRNGNVFYPILVHRLAGSFCASFPNSVALMQLRFTSLALVNSLEDFLLQNCAHAGRTH
jgi:hypothetical protein